VSGRIWRPLYQRSLNRNKFMFVVQNEEARESYSVHQGSVFAGKVVCVPLGTTNSVAFIPKNEARVKLGLPQRALILLSFGAPHSGKDVETVIKAMTRVPEVFMVHAGTQAFSLGSNPKRLTKRYELDDRTAIFDYYVTEEEKSLFFCAADALVLSYAKIFKSTSSMLWEATKYHLPVVSSNANMLGKMVKEYNLGLLFEAENVESLADAIRRFEALRPEEIELMETGRRRFVTDYSSARWIENTLELCKAVTE